MRNFKAQEWANIKTGHTIVLTSRDTYEIDIVSPGLITIVGHNEDGECIPIACSPNHLHVKRKFEGFTALEIVLKTAGGLRLMGRAAQYGEPMDDRTAPPPKEPTNILQQMRAVIKQELSANRESFLVNDTGLPGYETDDDSDDFEEELLEARQQQVDKLTKSPTNAEPDKPKKETPDAKPEQPAETPPASEGASESA